MQTSIIKYSETISVGRLDAEFYHPKYSCIEQKIKSFNCFLLSNKIIVSGPFGSTLKSDQYLDKGIPFIRITNIKGGFTIDKESLIFISEDNNCKLKNSQLFTGDMILSKVGNSIGYFARVDEKMETCNISENNIGIKLHMTNYSITQKYFILVYLNSFYGNQLVLRRRSGNAQPKLNVDDLSKIPIPIFSEAFQKEIESMVLEAHAKREEAIKLTKEAQTLLEKELDIYEWTPPKQALNISIKKYSDTTLANRIDAEYYQEKYEAILEKISQKWTLKTIGELDFDLTTGEYIESYLEKGSQGINYLRGTDISNMTFDYDKCVKIDNTKTYTKSAITGDILVTRVGTIGLTACVDTLLNNSIYSDNLIRTRFDHDIFNPLFLTCYLNTLGSQFMVQLSRGSVQQRLNQETLKELYIPIIDKNIQDIIAIKITSAHQARQESKRLLELAKYSVEHAIEHGE